MNVKFDVIAHSANIYQISGSIDDQIYLVVGKERAAVIDTGIGLGDLKKVIRKITDLPLVIINTHGHPDHAGGNGQFEEDEIFLQPADHQIYRSMCTIDFRKNDLLAANRDDAKGLFKYLIDGLPTTNDLSNNQVIDLGGRTLKVIEVPSHTPGSVVLFDSLSNCLFVGDVLTMTPTWLYLEHSLSVGMYLESMKKLRNMQLPVTDIFPGHLPVPVLFSILDKKIKCAEGIISEPDIGEYIETFAGQGYQYELDGVSIIYDKEKI